MTSAPTVILNTPTTSAGVKRIPLAWSVTPTDPTGRATKTSCATNRCGSPRPTTSRAPAFSISGSTISVSSPICSVIYPPLSACVASPPTSALSHWYRVSLSSSPTPGPPATPCSPGLSVWYLARRSGQLVERQYPARRQEGPQLLRSRLPALPRSHRCRSRAHWFPTGPGQQETCLARRAQHGRHCLCDL